MPPFFLKRGALAPFLRSSTPFWKKRGEERGDVYKIGGDRYQPKYRKSNKSDTGKIPIPKKLPVPPRYNSRQNLKDASRTEEKTQKKIAKYPI